MTSESTRFLGQPKERKPTVGKAAGVGLNGDVVASSATADIDSLLTYLL